MARRYAVFDQLKKETTTSDRCWVVDMAGGGGLRYAGHDDRGRYSSKEAMEIYERCCKARPKNKWRIVPIE